MELKVILRNKRSDFALGYYLLDYERQALVTVLQYIYMPCIAPKGSRRLKIRDNKKVM